MTSMITARVDSEKRSRAEKVFDEVGLTTSAAVNLFISAVAIRGGIPFPIEVHSPETARGDATRERASGVRLGLANGLYNFAPNFDESFDAMDDEITGIFD